MTLPNGADGLADNIALAFPLSAEQLDPNQSLATRDGFDQPTVEELLKDEIRASAGWNTAHQAGYGGLPAGLPQIIGILAKVAEQYTGIPVATWIAQWNANPVLANLSTVVTDSLAAIYQTSVNIQQFLGSLDFTDPDFNLFEAAETFIDIILAPVGKIATLIGGFISSLIIPGLDASKITTGQFGQSQITNLITDLAAKLGINLWNASQRAGANLVVDPTFEDSAIVRNYAGGSGSGYSTERSHSGTQAFKMVSNGGWDELDLIPVQGASGQVQNTYYGYRVSPGQRFYVEAWVYGRSVNTAPNNQGIHSVFTDTTGVNSTYYASIVAVVATPASTWTKLSGYITVPSGYDRFVPYWFTDNPTTVGNLYHIDDVIVREETAEHNVIEQIVNAFKQFAGTGWSLTDLFDVSWGQANQVGANAAAIARIQAQLDATTSGNSLTAKDTFEYTDTDSLETTTNWDGPEYLVGNSGIGYLRTDGHNAYSVGGDANWDAFYRFKGTNHTTQTSYQKATINWAWQMAYAPVFGDDRKAHWCVYVRMNAARTQWVRLKISSPGFLGSQVTGQWQYKNGGGITNLGSSFTFPNPTVGQPITLEAGTAGGLRQFRVSSYSNVINTTTDGSSVTAEGASNREGGLGAGYTVDDVLTGEHGSMGGIIQWTMTDNTEVSTVGSYGRVYRASTTGVGAGGTGDRVLPNLFDTTERISSDITFSDGNKFTVKDSGVYRIDFMVHNVAGMITSSPEPLLYITPSGGARALKRRGPHQYFASSSHSRIGFGWTEYLAAGDAVECGVNSPSFTPSWAGDSGGTVCYMTIGRQPPPLAPST